MNWHCIKIILFFSSCWPWAVWLLRKSLAKSLMPVKELVSHIQHRLNCKALGFFVFLHLLKKTGAWQQQSLWSHSYLQWGNKGEGLSAGHVRTVLQDWGMEPKPVLSMSAPQRWAWWRLLRQTCNELLDTAQLSQLSGSQNIPNLICRRLAVMPYQAS